MRKAEALRLVAAVAVAVGVFALVQALVSGGHKSSGSAKRALAGSAQGIAGGGASDPGSARSGSGSGGSSAAAGHVVVAEGPAVTRALQRGVMTVVIDQPSSGMFAEQNSSIAHGAEVAVQELNSAGGLAHHVHVRLVREPLDGLSASALKSRLSSQAGALLILPCDSDSQGSLAAAGSQYGLLMLAPCNADAEAPAHYATYWPVGMSVSDEAAGLASYLKNDAGYLRVFTVSAPGSSYVEQVTNDFRSAAQANGLVVGGSATIATTTQDFSSLAHTIEGIQPAPSVIFSALPPPLVNRMAAALRAKGLSVIVLGSSAMDTHLTVSRETQGLENALLASYGFPRLTAAAHRFEAAYSRKFGRAPEGSFPGLGLETIRLLAAAARKAGSAQPSAIQQALTGGLSLSGVGLGSRTYAPRGDHNPVGEVSVKKVTSGSFLQLRALGPSEITPP